MIPAWLQRVRGEAMRAARLHCCPRCGAAILSGLDDDNAARTAHADPTPITALGEAVALVAGRGTYDLMTVAGRKELWRRDEWHIGGKRKWPVIPDHECGKSLAAFGDDSWVRARYTSPEIPPF